MQPHGIFLGQNSATPSTGHLTGNFSPGPGTIWSRYIGFKAATSDSLRPVTAAIWSNRNGPCT